MGIKGDLLRNLQSSRSMLLAKVEDLSEFDKRRPMTPTGTNLLGLVKHLAGLEYGYLGASFGRPPPDEPSWFDDLRADMWAKPDESSNYIIDVYRQASAHADQTVKALDLDAPGHVSHWAVGHQETTLGVLLIRMVGETAHHAGHADIVREMIDGNAGSAQDPVGDDPEFWRQEYARVQGAADHFRA